MRIPFLCCVVLLCTVQAEVSEPGLLTNVVENEDVDVKSEEYLRANAEMEASLQELKHEFQELIDDIIKSLLGFHANFDGTMNGRLGGVMLKGSDGKELKGHLEWETKLVSKFVVDK
ncbi:hypothetical protein K7432_001468 [Basidiobolus ranarum]|uniref:Uncharacterized protein n=1 Tax=Basidiobolus ranarum TaxID=34480 RepID=A0ABR2X2Z7_9FUNG